MKELLAIQQELKAPKGQYNSFGKYKYRSCENILEAVKPILAKHKCALTLSDTIVQVGERYYIKAEARLINEMGAEKSTIAYAREPLDKKGMDESQITGTASSYARKYALNGLFAIDDTKDADTDEYHNQTQSKASASAPAPAPKAEPKIADAKIVAQANACNTLAELKDLCNSLIAQKKWNEETKEVFNNICKNKGWS